MLLKQLRLLCLLFPGLAYWFYLSIRDRSPPQATRHLFPKKIWQTYRTDVTSLATTEAASLRSWLKHNPDWRYEAMSDGSAETYVRGTDYGSFFMHLQDPILRADFLRFLLLWTEGGLYTDLDTAALRPIPEPMAGANLIVGVEYDRLDWSFRWPYLSHDLSLATWTIMAKQNHPVMKLMLKNMMQALNNLAVLQHTTISSLKLNTTEVLDSTGPGMFADTVFEYITTKVPDFTWREAIGLTRPTLFADVLILPIDGLGCGQPHSNSGPCKGEAWVQHLFKGSWLEDHGQVIGGSLP